MSNPPSPVRISSGYHKRLSDSFAPFRPAFRNPHLATILTTFWPRTLDTRRYPVHSRLFHTESGVQVLIDTQQPENPRGEVVLVHGLEGSSHAPYMRSMAQALLEDGFTVHRTNIRSCGGTEFLCSTLYHAGLTKDIFAILTDLDRQRRTPVFLVGFSLGGNQALKMAGELGGDAHRLLAGVVAISTPIDLAECGRGLSHPNPRVGAVIVADGAIVGRGFHRGPGTPHAEALALAEAGGRASGSSLFCTLEPCAHHGNTPPCADAIVAAGVSRVVIGMLDPKPLVHGRGGLRASGGYAPCLRDAVRTRWPRTSAERSSPSR